MIVNYVICNLQKPVGFNFYAHVPTDRKYKVKINYSSINDAIVYETEKEASEDLIKERLLGIFEIKKIYI